MIIDRKFLIYAKSRSSDTVYTEQNAIVFLARDIALPAALREYLRECRALKCDQMQLGSIEVLYSRVIAFQADHGFQKAAVETKEEFLRLTKE